MTKNQRYKIGSSSCTLLGTLVIALTMLGTPVWAQESISLSTGIDAPMKESGLTISNNELQLTIEEAVAIALERNLGLLVQRYERAQFDLQIDESRGIYDTTLGGNFSISEETSASATALDGADVLTQESTSYNLEANQLTPWGGTGTAQFGTFKRESNSTFSSLNPSFTSGLDLKFSQPLLRNRGRDNTERGIRIARLNQEMNQEGFEQQVTSTIQQVINTYFALLEARQQVAVSKESKDLAVELHDMNQIRVEVGTLAPLELIQSEVGIATREEEIIRAEQSVGDAEDDLRTLLNLEEGNLWDVSIIPEAADDPVRVATDLEESIQKALESRPELASKRLELERLGIDVDFFKNQALPSLGATVTYGYNGLGGDLIQRAPDGTVLDVTPGGFGDSLDQIFDREYDGWRIELNFGMPIQNRTAKGRRTRAELDADQGRLELGELTQSIRTEVRKAVRAVGSAEKQIDSARASVRLAEKNLDAERKRYENGLSTSYQVLEIQEDLSEARRREVSAIATYRRALAAYYRSTGGLLEISGVEWSETSDVE